MRGLLDPEDLDLLDMSKTTVAISNIAPPATAPVVTKFNAVFQSAVREIGPVTVKEYEGEVETIIPATIQTSRA